MVARADKSVPRTIAYIIFNAKFIILNTKFIMFNANSPICLPDKDSTDHPSACLLSTTIRIDGSSILTDCHVRFCLQVRSRRVWRARLRRVQARDAPHGEDLAGDDQRQGGAVTLKVMNFVLKMINFALKNDQFA